MCSAEKDCIAKRAWLRQYSQQPRARSSTKRFSAALARRSAIGGGPDSKIDQELRQGNLAQLRQSGKGLHALSLTRLRLICQPHELIVLLGGQRLLLPFRHELLV